MGCDTEQEGLVVLTPSKLAWLRAGETCRLKLSSSLGIRLYGMAVEPGAGGTLAIGGIAVVIEAVVIEAGVELRREWEYSPVLLMRSLRMGGVLEPRVLG